jgi:hypothetical protein
MMTMRATISLIDVDDVATWLSIPRGKVIAMAREGSIPCYALPCRSGKKGTVLHDYVFAPDEIANWLQSHRQTAGTEATT